MNARLTIAILLTVICAALIATAAGWYATMPQDREAIVAHVTARDAPKLYYDLQPIPQSADAPSTGDGAITVIAYLDFTSDGSRRFMETEYPVLQEYIKEHKVTYVHKDAVAPEDMTNETATARAQRWRCLYEENSTQAWDTYLQFFTDKQIDELPKANGDCQESEWLSAEAQETRRLGIVGVNPNIYIGIHGKDNTQLQGVVSEQVLRQTLKNYQVRIGD